MSNDTVTPTEATIKGSTRYAARIVEAAANEEPLTRLIERYGDYRVAEALTNDRPAQATQEVERLRAIERTARALMAAEAEYARSFDKPRPDPLPDLDDPAVAAEWFGPHDRMQAVRAAFLAALAEEAGTR